MHDAYSTVRPSAVTPPGPHISRRRQLSSSNNNQDVAILCLLFFCCWEAAKRCEGTQQPLALKYANIVRIIKKHWKSCGVRLQEGKYIKRVFNRYDFDGQALLQLVTKYRSNTKGRSQMRNELQIRLREYYQVYVFVFVFVHVYMYSL